MRELTPQEQKRQRLLSLAFKFYTFAEAPSDDDWECVFAFLVDHDLEKLENFTKDIEGDGE